MEKVFKCLKKCVLIYVIIYTIIILCLNLLLNKFNMNFREWVYIFSICVIGLGSIIGVFQLIFKFKKKVIKIILSIIFVICIFIITSISLIIYIFTYNPEYVVQKDGKKMIAYVEFGGMSDEGGYSKVRYYEYKNFLYYENDVKIEEMYKSNPFENSSNQEVLNVTYYDNNIVVNQKNNGN